MPIENDDLLENIDQAELPPKDVPQTTKDALLRLGSTILGAINSVIAMAITQYAQQQVALLETQLTNSAVMSILRAQADSIIQPVENFKKTTLAVLDTSDALKYLELFPEIRQPVQTAIDAILDTFGQVESVAEDIKRMTYTNDLVSGMISTISSNITELAQVQKLIGSLLGG
jgi:methyl-accepting chemotaxis protein